MDAILFLGTVMNIGLTLYLIGTWDTAIMGMLWITIPFSLIGILFLWEPKVPPKK